MNRRPSFTRLSVFACLLAGLLVSACGSSQNAAASLSLSGAVNAVDAALSSLGDPPRQASTETPVAPSAHSEDVGLVTSPTSVRRSRAAVRPVELPSPAPIEPPTTVIPSAPVAELSTSVSAVAEDPTVYSTADVDVAPPRAPVPTRVRPWRADLSEPGPAIEVTVASNGSVEKVRMLSTARLPDMMLLSHIKTWRFEPALREGAPVRYRIKLNDPIVAP